MRALKPAAIVYHSVMLTVLMFLLYVTFIFTHLGSACRMPPTYSEWFFDLFSFALIMCSPVLVGAAVQGLAYHLSEGRGSRAYAGGYLVLTLVCCLALAAVRSSWPNEDYEEWYAARREDCGG